MFPRWYWADRSTCHLWCQKKWTQQRYISSDFSRSIKCNIEEKFYRKEFRTCRYFVVTCHGKYVGVDKFYGIKNDPSSYQTDLTKVPKLLRNYTGTWNISCVIFTGDLISLKYRHFTKGGIHKLLFLSCWWGDDGPQRPVSWSNTTVSTIQGR